MFQNLSVSSPAPVTIVDPSGDIAKYSTLYYIIFILPACMTNKCRYSLHSITFPYNNLILTISMCRNNFIFNFTKH